MRHSKRFLRFRAKNVHVDFQAFGLLLGYAFSASPLCPRSLSPSPPPSLSLSLSLFDGHCSAAAASMSDPEAALAEYNSHVAEGGVFEQSGNYEKAIICYTKVRDRE